MLFETMRRGVQSTKFSDKLYRTNNLVSSTNTLQLKKDLEENLNFKKPYQPIVMHGLYLNPVSNRLEKKIV